MQKDYLLRDILRVADVQICLIASLSINQEDDRIPSTISFAECLCRGCIINQQENLSFNSVLVFAPMIVMRKTKCDDDPQKYVLKKKSLRVPVACTCAVPKSD